MNVCVCVGAQLDVSLTEAEVLREERDEKIRAIELAPGFAPSVSFGQQQQQEERHAMKLEMQEVLVEVRECGCGCERVCFDCVRARNTHV